MAPTLSMQVISDSPIEHRGFDKSWIFRSTAHGYGTHHCCGANGQKIEATCSSRYQYHMGKITRRIGNAINPFKKYDPDDTGYKKMKERRPDDLIPPSPTASSSARLPGNAPPHGPSPGQPSSSQPHPTTSQLPPTPSMIVQTSEGLSPAVLASNRPLDLSRTYHVAPVKEESTTRPGFDFKFDNKLATDLEIPMATWKDGHRNRRAISSWLHQYEADPGFRKRINHLVKAPQLSDSYQVVYSEDTKHDTCTLWEAAVVLAGVHHASNTFSRLLLIRNSDDVKHLTKKFGRRFFTLQTMVDSLFYAGSRCFDMGSDNASAAMCARELVVCGLVHADVLKESKASKKNNELGLWAEQYESIFRDMNRLYVSAPTENERARLKLEWTQDLAAMSAIVEGASYRYFHSIDEKEVARRDQAQIVTSAAIVGLTVGLTAIAHFPPLILAALPLMELVKERFINKHFVLHEYAKMVENMRVQRIAKSQGLYVARFRDTGDAPSPQEAAEIRNIVDTYRSAEDAVHGLLQLAP